MLKRRTFDTFKNPRGKRVHFTRESNGFCLVSNHSPFNEFAEFLLTRRSLSNLAHQLRIFPSGDVLVGNTRTPKRTISNCRLDAILDGVSNRFH